MHIQEKRENFRNIEFNLEKLLKKFSHRQLEFTNYKCKSISLLNGGYIKDDIISINFSLYQIKDSIKLDSIRITKEVFNTLNSLITMTDELIKKL